MSKININQSDALNALLMAQGLAVAAMPPGFDFFRTPAPSPLPFPDSITLQKAEEKRLRKQQKRIKK